MENLSFWQIVGWSCCAAPVALVMLCAVLGTIFGGLTSVIHGRSHYVDESGSEDSHNSK